MLMAAEAYQQTAEQVLQELASTKQGLSETDARNRLEKFGPNKIERKKKVHPLIIFFSQFKSFLIALLLFAVLVSVLIQHFIDASVILAIVILNAVLGFVQEYRAGKAAEALEKLATQKATVIRGGKTRIISAEELVPGDIVVLNTGDKVPADCRLIEAVNLKIDESLLTGESVPVIKDTDKITATAQLAERKNCAFSNTIVVYGKGTGVVFATGGKTEVGRIAELITEAKEKETVLQQKLRYVAKVLGIAVVVIAAAVFGLGIFQGLPIFDIFLTSIALAVAAVPEGLPAVITITLAIGMSRMAKAKAVVRQLPAVETLGSCSWICTDKTGTLTKNEMTVRQLFTNNKVYKVTGIGYEPKGDFLLDDKKVSLQKDPHAVLLFRISALCNDASLVQENDKWSITGDPTEGALLVVAGKAGFGKDSLQKEFPQVAELSFDAVRKKMSTIHKAKREFVVLTKGAPDLLLEKCKYILRSGSVHPLSAKERVHILKVNEQMANKALRVLGFAYKTLHKVPKKPEADVVERDLVFVGLVGMIDPPRPEAAEAIKEAESAGIQVTVVTGDHKETARAIAKQIGLLKEGTLVVDGTELDSMSDEQLEEIVEHVSVFARVSPEHKVRIVHALQKHKHIVAMTGDGVNDAPALKSAEIGVAMGLSGTDVAKEASAMVLEDDNFATIVKAVKEGRTVYDNIKKFLRYLLTSNVGEVLIILLASLLFLPLPLVAVQLLWINLITDGLPAVALGIDPPDPDVMKRKPRSKDEPPIDRDMLVTVALVGVIIAAGTLGIFNYLLAKGASIEFARTAAFTSIVLFELFNVYGMRSDRLSAFKLPRNKWLHLAVLASLLLQITVLYLPPLQTLFSTVALDLGTWMLIISVTVSVLVVIEIRKLLRKKQV